MNADCVKLTIYFGERDRAEGRFLADVLLDRYEHHGVATSILLRGIEGFGAKHRLKTQRLLTLSEDLPIVSVVVDTHQRIDQVLSEMTAVKGDGLITLQRARLVAGDLDEIALPEELAEATKLTVYLGRHEQAGERAARSPTSARLLLELGDGRPESITGPMVTMGAVAGDPVALASFEAVGTWLDHGMADVAAILDPRVFIAGGGVSEAGELLVDPARETFERREKMRCAWWS